VLNGFGDALEVEAIRSSIERAHGVRAVYNSADMSQGVATCCGAAGGSRSMR
jgi:3-hydroxybutyrate dehydrogenase